MNRYGYEEERISWVLTEEQSRAHRAKAWRHCRRINPKVARQVWLRSRHRADYVEAV